MTSTRDRIMDEAEAMLRTGGFHGFSFRDIANAVDIKSASVHHHFPTKEDLVLAVTERYHERFLGALGTPEDAGAGPALRLRHYGRVFLQAFLESRRTCLCGMLSTESLHLPTSIRKQVQQTAADNLDWIERAILLQDKGQKLRTSTKASRAHAVMVYCAMEGAIHLAALQDDEGKIEQVIAATTRIDFP